MGNRKKDDFIKCVKLIRYGLSVKQSLGTMVVFMIVGICCEMLTTFVGEEISFTAWLDLGVLFLICAAMYPPQLLISMDMSSMIQASPYKKKLQTTAPALLSLGGNLIVMALVLLIRGLGAWVAPDRAASIWGSLPFVGIMILIMGGMMALVYKFYVLCIVIMCVGFGSCGGAWGYRMGMEMSAGISTGTVRIMSAPAAVLFCLAMVFLSAAIQYLVNKAVYKRPFSKLAFGSNVAKKFM